MLRTTGQEKRRRKNKDELAKRIGSRLKELRKNIGVSMKQLTEETKLSAALFSRVENGLVMPSIPTLQLISNFFKVDIGYFFRQGEEKDYVITRSGNRRVVRSKRGPYQIELLAEGMENPFMEPCIVTELAKPYENFPLAKHDGQEFVYVLEGKLELTLGEKKLALNKGDSAYFIGEIPHGGKSFSKKPAKTINVHLIPGTRIRTFETQD